jgi:hypothetical protein
VSIETEFLAPRLAVERAPVPASAYGPVDPSLPRIQTIKPGPYYCGVLVCTGCGATVAQCGCGRADISHFCDTCPGCATDGDPQVWVDPKAPQ